MLHQLSDIHRRTDFHVGADTAKENAAYEICAVLLQGPERGRWLRQIYHNGCPMGGERETKEYARRIRDVHLRHKKQNHPEDNYGFSRVGCIGCPLAGKGDRYAEFLRWPKYKQAYMRAFEKMLEVRRNNGMETQWKNADEVLHWWMEDGVLHGQIGFEDLEEEFEDA